MSRSRVQYQVAPSHNITDSNFAHLDGGLGRKEEEKKKRHMFTFYQTHMDRDTWTHTNTLFFFYVNRVMKHMSVLFIPI